MVVFTHLDAGTSEEIWRSDHRVRSGSPLDHRIGELVVVAAHPDDETLGAGGLIRRVHQNGGRVTVIVATDGEGSHPGSMSHSRTDLASIRRGEVRRAVQALDPDAHVRFIGLPDGALRENAAALEGALGTALDVMSPGAGRRVIVAPWSGDGHRDHRVTAECVARVAAERGILHLGYPIWLWHWGQPDDVPWDSSVVLALTPGERSIKARALRSHASQVNPLSDAAGDEAIISQAMRAHFERDTELYFLETHDEEPPTMKAAWFDDFYERHADPWGFETRWYEQRKRALLMAVLPSHELGRVLEIGCATGLVTNVLAARADHVVGMDASRAALEAARTRLGSRSNVSLQRGAVPDQWPDGIFDTIVFSEVGYYLSPTDLARTTALIEAALAHDGNVVACHWRHPVAAYPLSGDDVHRSLRSVASWERLILHEEEDFVLEVFCPAPALSVAQREGLH